MGNLLSIWESLQPHLIDNIVYVAIAVVTFIGLIKCLIPLWTTTAAMHRAVRKLQDDAGTVSERPVWQESRFLGKRLRGSWLRFLQNAEQLDRRGLPCHVEDYINEETVTHGPGNAPLAELIPSLLTSLGILGTFLGMTEGLSGLDVTTTDRMMNGIQNLLSGMQFAFGTSVAGVACSIIFNMLNHVAQGSSYRALDDFTESFTTLAMQRPLDNDVQMIIQNQDRNHMLRVVSDAVTTTMPAAMEQAVSNAMIPVARSMDQFLIGATKSQIDGVARVVDHFVDQMNISLNGQFLLLGKTMTEINQNQAASMDRVGQSLEAVREMMQDVTHLHEVSDALLRQFEHYISELSLARSRDEKFEKNSQDLLSEMHKMSREQVQAMDSIRRMQTDLQKEAQDFERASQKALENMNASNLVSSRALSDNALTIQDASQKLSDRYATFSQEIVEALSRSLSMFEKSMQDVLSSFTAQLQASDASEITEISRMQKTLAGMQASVEKMEASLSHRTEEEA